MNDHELPASIPSPRTSVEYMHEGPVFDHENIHEAMGMNTAHALSAHMIRRSRMGMNRPVGPGHAEAAASIRDALRPGSDLYDEMEPATGSYDVEEAARQNPHSQVGVAPRLRSRAASNGNTAASRAPHSPRTRRGPGGPSRP